LCVPVPDVPSDYKHRGDLESEVGVRKACRFSRSLLGECSGLEDPDFGFKEGKPCIIVKLNRIVNFRPRVKKKKKREKCSEMAARSIVVVGVIERL